jgi:hypothetical protein
MKQYHSVLSAILESLAQKGLSLAGELYHNACVAFGTTLKAGKRSRPLLILRDCRTVEARSFLIDGGCEE